jgi:hypothetical protein
VARLMRENQYRYRGHVTMDRHAFEHGIRRQAIDVFLVTAQRLPLSPSVLATLANRPQGLELLVLWRGAPGWYLSSGQRSARFGEHGGAIETTISYARIVDTLAVPSDGPVDPRAGMLAPFLKRSPAMLALLQCDGLFLTDLASVLIPLVPFSLIAGWRTRVYARRYRDRRGNGWQGVIEAGVLGFMAALLVLSHGIATRPRDAWPYIIVYGGGAALLGLAFGLLLWTTAHIVLNRLGAR